MVNLTPPDYSASHKQEKILHLTVPPNEIKQRLDLYIVNNIEDVTRSHLAKLIREGYVVVNGSVVKGGYKVRSGDVIKVVLPARAQSSLVPEEIEFEILFEDNDMIVISKPPGLVVHPAAGHETGTLVHGLLFRYQNLPNHGDGRPGIVHRLDKDTSGVMLVAKTEDALRGLSADFKDRKIHKIYHAVLTGCPTEASGRIVAPIGRHPVNRKKMAIRQVRGRYAASNWNILEYFSNGWCFAEIEIETGRTHQIRVHMASLRAPVCGDSIYGGKVNYLGTVLPERQLLHASEIAFNHPVTSKQMYFTAPLWPDLQQCLQKLREIA